MSVEIVRRPSMAARPSRGHGRQLVVALGILLLALGLWLEGRPEFVAWQLVRDHGRGLASRPGGRVWSSEPAVVVQWLERRGTPLPPLPASAGGAGLVGARHCALVDRIAAHVLYEGEQASVSLFVVTGPLRAPNGWSTRVAGVHLRLVRSAGRTLAVVGENEEDVASLARTFATSVARARAQGATRLACAVVDPPGSSW